MGPIAWRRLRLAVAFTSAAWRYWLFAFPLARRELARLRRAARAIPDPVLRGIALETLEGEHGNLEGAAAFAAFAPLRRRAAVVRATVAFQAAYDYVDSLAEQPHAAAGANARALHEALAVALRPGAPHGDYYRHGGRSDDGGYLRRLVDACRAALGGLPSAGVIEPALARAAERMIGYQERIHGGGGGPGGGRPGGGAGAGAGGGEAGASALAAWAAGQRPRGSGLRWWETAAACASSLGVFALVTAAARPGLSDRDAAAIDGAYFPWVGGLHVLLDSLVDRPADVEAGHLSLVARYASPGEAAERLGSIAASAFAAAGALPNGEQHTVLLAAMAAFYLSSPAARLPHAAPARGRVLGAVGGLERVTLAILRIRRASRRVAPTTDTRYFRVAAAVSAGDESRDRASSLPPDAKSGGVIQTTTT